MDAAANPHFWNKKMKPKKPKVWCRHIEWLRLVFIGNGYWNYIPYKGQDIQVPRSWKLCPICGKRRPKK